MILCMSRTTVKNLNHEAIYEAHKRGLSYTEISKVFDCSKSLVGYIIKKKRNPEETRLELKGYRDRKQENQELTNELARLKHEVNRLKKELNNIYQQEYYKC